MKNIFKNKKVITIIAIIVATIVVAIGGTYAWYVWSTSNDERTKIVTGVGVATVLYDAGSNIIGENIMPVSDKTLGLVKTITVNTSRDSTSKISFNLYLDIVSLAEELKHESFKFELYHGSTLIKSGNFTQNYLDKNLVTCNTNGTNHIVLTQNAIVSKTTDSYTIYIWIDGKNYDNPYEMENKSFEFQLHADGQNAIISESKYPDTNTVSTGTLAYNIVNKYDSNTDKTVINNGNVRYYYDTTNNLMSDVDGNVRYYGSNPNNYVYFNCENYNNPNSSTCELWRIVGVFDGKVKLVKEQNIGSYAWDYTNTGNYSNIWNGSAIEELLNNGYYNNTDGAGLTEETRNNSLIANNVWYLNGIETASFSDQVYIAEKNGSNTWMGKVGMISASDYGYATDFNKCTSELYGYNDSTCTSNNWIYSMGQGNAMWLMPPREEISTLLWSVSSDGKIISEDNTSSSYNVYPTVYIEEDVLWYGGDGSKTDPYIVYPSGLEENKGNAIEYISSLYNSYNKDVVTNNSIEYNYASTVSLMNDRLGGTTSDYNAGNIRYYGANPNNYVDIGDRDSSGSVIPYRIIGIFKDMELSDGTKKDLIKVIRADSIGTYSWTQYATHDYYVDWSVASLMILLNPGYDKYSVNNPFLDASGDTIYGYKGSLWWNSGSGTCYSGNSTGTITCNFTSTGLSSGVHDKIETVVWNIGKINWLASHLANDIYVTERNSSYTEAWEGRVALMYISDYQYATNFNKCDTSVGTSEDVTDECVGNDWLHMYDIYEWTLAPFTNSTHSVFTVGAKSSIIDADNKAAVRPVFYLDSELNIESGIGVIDKPYVLG